MVAVVLVMRAGAVAVLRYFFHWALQMICKIQRLTYPAPVAVVVHAGFGSLGAQYCWPQHVARLSVQLVPVRGLGLPEALPSWSPQPWIHPS